MSIFKIKRIFLDKNYWFFREVEFASQGINEYIDNSDKIITSIKKSLGQYESQLRNWPAHKVKRSFNVIEYYSKRFSHQLYYNSIFITEYSFLERKMLQICKIAESKQRLKLNDITGKGIFKYYIYFEKVLKIDMSEVNSEWSQILKYNELRNLLVHHPTYIIENDSPVKAKLKLLKSIKYLLIEEDDGAFEFQITDKRLLKEFNHTIVEFLAGIYYDNS